MTFSVTWAPAANAAEAGGAGVPSQTATRASKAKKARKAKQKSPAKQAPQVQESQQQEGSAAGGAGLDAAAPVDARPTVPGSRAVLRDGLAYAPAAAPLEVQEAVWAANELLDKPYIYGGGHKSFRADGYDCSGTVSYALNGAGLLDSPLDSSSFMTLGRGRQGHVDHRLHEPRPRLRDHRRPAARHERPGRGGAALAPRQMVDARLQGASPRELLSVGTCGSPPFGGSPRPIGLTL